jgi:hypothetical protein
MPDFFDYAHAPLNKLMAVGIRSWAVVSGTSEAGTIFREMLSASKKRLTVGLAAPNV